MWRKFYNLLIKYRLWIGIVLIALGVFVNYSSSFWPAFPLYLVGVILIAGHFFFGPLRLIREYMESGDMEGAEKVLNTIKFPNLLYKPIRSVYYTLKGLLAIVESSYHLLLPFFLIFLQKYKIIMIYLPTIHVVIDL